MEMILKQVNVAMDYGLYYLAVAIALTLPDICAALESADGTAKPDRYKNWYREWLQPRYPMLEPNDVYVLRSGINHRGQSEPHGIQPTLNFDKVVFVIPHLSRTNSATDLHCRIEGVTGDRTLSLDAAFFCQDVLQSVHQWYAKKATDPNVVANMPKVLTFRPDGFPPHFVGVPVIA
jgi:hypothetical protein